MAAKDMNEWYIMLEKTRGDILNEIQRLESLEYNECDFNSYQEYESKLKSKSKSIDTFKDSVRQYEYYLSTI